MPKKIQIKRGLKANLPTLEEGEPAFCTDTKQPYIGDGSNNHEILTSSTMNAKGDIITATADNAQDILSIGTDTQVLTADSAQANGVKWATPASGGMTDPMTTRGDIIVKDASNVTARLGVGTNGQVLKSDGADVAWAAESGGGSVNTSGIPVANDFARFTDADTIEGRSYSEAKTDLSLNNVENTAHSSDAHTMTIDGRDVSADGGKLDGIEASAKDDQTASEVPIVDSGVIITATDVEGALQENRTAINLNTAKSTNVSTALSTGTITATTYGITSDGGTDDVVLPEANTSQAGLLGADKWDEVTANTLKKTNATHTGEVTGDEALTIANNAVTNAKLNDVATATIKGRVTAATGDPEDLTPTQVRTLINVETGAEVNNISDINATDLTDGGDTTLHDHDGISENTNARHTQGTDVALGSLGTKATPIDADKVIQRDSADFDAIKTSTWTQIKAFLKTYFDTLYNNYAHPNHSGDITSTGDGATVIGADKVKDTMIDWGTGAGQVSSDDIPDHSGHSVNETFDHILNRGKAAVSTITLTGGLGISWIEHEIYDSVTETFITI